MARWVVIGGTGTIGGALCRHLVSAGQEVLSVSRAPRGPEGCEHLSFSLLPENDLSGLFRAGDRIVYAAGLAGRVDCERNPHLARWLNSDCPVALLRAADSAGAESFVYLSSVKALRPPAGVLANEDSGTPAADVYGRSKWLGERQLLAEPVRCRLNLIRPASVYGGDSAAARAQRWRGLLRTWGRLAPLPASGCRSFVSLSDLLAAIALVAEAADCNRETFIAAEPRFYDLAAIASAASGARTRACGWLTRLLLAPVRPLRRLPIAHKLLELEQSELYSAARLRSTLPWRAEGRYSEFLRGVS